MAVEAGHDSAIVAHRQQEPQLLSAPDNGIRDMSLMALKAPIAGDAIELMSITKIIAIVLTTSPAPGRQLFRIAGSAGLP